MKRKALSLKNCGASLQKYYQYCFDITRLIRNERDNSTPRIENLRTFYYLFIS